MIAQIYDINDNKVLAKAPASDTKQACEWIRTKAKDYSRCVNKHWWFSQNGDKTEVDFGSHRYFARIIATESEVK